MIPLSLIILAAICVSVMDVVQFHFYGSVFAKYPKFCNPETSWKNKYKEGTTIPKFFGSTTFLVWTTDLWHLAKMIAIISFLLAIVFYKVHFSFGMDLTILLTVYTGIFELFYSKLLMKNK
jgi:hypothetical protein